MFNVAERRDRTPLPAALDCRGTARLFCRARPQRTGVGLCLFRGRAGAQISGKIIGARRSKTDRCQHCEIAGAIRTPSDVGCAMRRRIAANIAKLPELVQKASPCYRAALNPGGELMPFQGSPFPLVPSDHPLGPYWVVWPDV